MAIYCVFRTKLLEWVFEEHKEWFKENAENKPQPVGTKRENTWGIFDVLGNIRISGPTGV